MATIKDLRAQAKARKVKGYSRMNKSQLMGALGVTEQTKRPKGDARARATAKKSGVAKTYAADKISAKLAGGDAERAAALKKEVLKRVASHLRKAEKAKGDKLTPQEKRQAAVKAIRDVASETRAGNNKSKGGLSAIDGGGNSKPRTREEKEISKAAMRLQAAMERTDASMAELQKDKAAIKKKHRKSNKSKTSDRPNLTTVDGGKSGKLPKARGARLIDRSDEALAEADAKFNDAKARADQLRQKKTRSQKLQEHLTPKQTEIQLSPERKSAFKDHAELTLKPNWSQDDHAKADATIKQLKQNGDFTQAASLIDKQNREKRKQQRSK